MNPKKRRQLLKQIRHQRRLQNKRTTKGKLAVLKDLISKANQVSHNVDQLVALVNHVVIPIITQEQLKVYRPMPHLSIGDIEQVKPKQRHLLNRTKLSVNQLDDIQPSRRRRVMNRPKLNVDPIEIGDIQERRVTDNVDLNVQPLQISSESIRERPKLSHIELNSFDVKMPQMSSENQIGTSEHLNLNDLVSPEVVQLYQQQPKILVYYPDWNVDSPMFYQFPVPWTQRDEGIYQAFAMQSIAAIQTVCEQSRGQGMVEVLKEMGVDYDIVGKGMFDLAIWRTCMMYDYDDIAPDIRPTVQRILTESSIDNVQSVARETMKTIADYYHASYGTSDDNGQSAPEV